MKIEFHPSLMCADFSNLEKEISTLNQCDIDAYHIDYMDGYFVDNIAMGIQDLDAIRRLTNKKLEIHLMAKYPEKLIDLMAEHGADCIYLHAESDGDIGILLEKIRKLKVCAGLAINPGTNINTLKDSLYFADAVLLMCVNPGFAGQVFLPFIDEKIKKIVTLKNKYKFKLILDGACSKARISQYAVLGVDGFVLGTAALFNKGKTYESLVRELRNAIEGIEDGCKNSYSLT